MPMRSRTSARRSSRCGGSRAGPPRSSSSPRRPPRHRRSRPPTMPSPRCSRASPPTAVNTTVRMPRSAACAAGSHAIPQSSAWLATLFSTVEAAHSIGDVEIAREAADLLEPYADLPVLGSLAVVCLGSPRRSLGLAALTAGDLDARHRAARGRARRQRPARQPPARCAHRSRSRGGSRRPRARERP